MWLIIAQTAPSGPTVDQFDQWINRGVAGAVISLFAWVIMYGLPNIIKSFREETKEHREAHQEVIKTVSENHAKAVEAVTKEAASQREQFKASLEKTVEKFTDKQMNDLKTMIGSIRADGTGPRINT